MDARCLSLLLVVVVTVNGLNRGLLSNKPPEMKSFHVDKYLGRWYRAFTLVPCRWNGANKFTDWVVHYYKDKSDGQLKYHNHWRHGSTCSNTPGHVKLCGTSRYTYGDSIGVISSGEAIIVATDYKSFGLTWGCVKYVGDQCQEAWMDVDTRKPGITKKVKEIVDKILKELFGISTSDLSAVSHNNAC